MVILTENEKEILCQRLSNELPRVRKFMKLTQSELGDLCGLSRITISKIETGVVKLSWLHFMALSQIFAFHKEAKEYLLTRGVFDPKYLQSIQVKDSNIPPDINVLVRDELIHAYITHCKESLSADYI
jgi:DNA-binding XRE family transcriptional regulator